MAIEIAGVRSWQPEGELARGFDKLERRQAGTLSAVFAAKSDRAISTPDDLRLFDDVIEAEADAIRESVRFLVEENAEQDIAWKARTVAGIFYTAREQRLPILRVVAAEDTEFDQLDSLDDIAKVYEDIFNKDNDSLSISNFAKHYYADELKCDLGATFGFGESSIPKALSAGTETQKSLGVATINAALASAGEFLTTLSQRDKSAKAVLQQFIGNRSVGGIVGKIL